MHKFNLSEVKKKGTLALFSTVAVLTLAACGQAATEEPAAAESASSEVASSESTTEESTASESAATETESGIALVAEKPEVADVEVNNAPNRITATIKGDPSTEMAFNWYTTEEVAESAVTISTNEDMSDAQTFEATPEEVTNQYAERDKDGYYIYADVEKDEEGETVEENGEPVINGYYTDENLEPTDEWMTGDGIGQITLQDVTEYSYKADASGLTPNTTYYYQVGSEEGEKSEVGTFDTAGAAGDPFTFVHYTDTQNAYWNENVRNEAAFGADTIAQAIDTVDADFILHTGDIVETAEVEDEWVDIMAQSQDSFLQEPLSVVPGNHDEYALNDGDEPVTEKFNQHFNVDAENDAVDGGSYYSYDYNGVHFVSLNTNDNKTDGKMVGPEQMEWIRQDVEEARANGAEWVIMTYHKPLYSASYHSLSDEDVQAVREELTALIDELDIDLALQGHDHVLSRTNSLTHVPTEESFSNAEVAEDASVMEDRDGVPTYVNPTGTTYILPNTGGTKLYDYVYGKSLDHLHKVRPALDWMTQEDLDHYNSLFALAAQPETDDPAFEESHSNNRDSSTQNFATYTVEGNELTVGMYQVSGNVLEDEERTVDLVDEFAIVKE